MPQPPTYLVELPDQYGHDKGNGYGVIRCVCQCIVFDVKFQALKLIHFLSETKFIFTFLKKITCHTLSAPVYVLSVNSIHDIDRQTV